MNLPKVFIPSYNRPLTITTPQLLDKLNMPNYVVLLHSEEQRQLYLQNKKLDPNRLLVTHQPPGVTNQRNFITKTLVPFGQWYISMDDNITAFRGVAPHLYAGRLTLPVQDKAFDRKAFEHTLEGDDLRQRLQDEQLYAERNGIFYIGFATVPNFYFLGKKRRHVGYVISKAVLIFNQKIGYDPNLEAMEDFGFCAEHHLRHGKVLINNWFWPQAQHYQPGGIGTYEQRVPRKRRDCAYLLKKYPGFFRYKAKKGCDPLAELQVRFTSTEQVDKWRKQLRAGTAPS